MLYTFFAYSACPLPLFSPILPPPQLVATSESCYQSYVSFLSFCFEIFWASVRTLSYSILYLLVILSVILFIIFPMSFPAHSFAACIFPSPFFCALSICSLSLPSFPIFLSSFGYCNVRGHDSVNDI